MNNTVRILVVSAVLVVLTFLMYAPPFAQHPWAEAAGVTEGDFQILPFVIMLAGWILYGFVFRWVYTGMKMNGLKDALLLGARLWMFLVFPVITVHYLFLSFSWRLIFIDGISQLVVMLAGAVMLWGWTLHSAPEKATS